MGSISDKTDELTAAGATTPNTSPAEAEPTKTNTDEQAERGADETAPDASPPKE